MGAGGGAAAARRSRLRGGTGIHRQLPGFEEAVGLRQGRRCSPSGPSMPISAIEQSARRRRALAGHVLQPGGAGRPAAAGRGAAARSTGGWSCRSASAPLGQRARRLRARRRAARPAPQHQRALGLGVVFVRRQPVPRPPDRRDVRRRLRSAAHLQRLRPVPLHRSVQPRREVADRQQHARRSATGSSEATVLRRRRRATRCACRATRGSTSAPIGRSTGKRSGSRCSSRC